jgi:hypothetical protein
MFLVCFQSIINFPFLCVRRLKTDPQIFVSNAGNDTESCEEFEKGFPAQFIAEGLDQTRGWFYTLMVRWQVKQVLQVRKEIEIIAKLSNIVGVLPCNCER